MRYTMTLKMLLRVCSTFVALLVSQNLACQLFDYGNGPDEIQPDTPLCLCEGEDVVAECPEGKVIKWKSAKYKTLEDSNDRCFSEGTTISPRQCRTKYSLRTVQQFCDGRPECQFSVNDTFFEGDPCYDVFNDFHLKVTYSCRAGTYTNPQTTNICEKNNRHSSLDCQYGNIDIMSASYKTDDNNVNICGREITDSVDCSKDVTVSVSNLCDGEKSCTFPQLRATFGDPCADTFKSYFEFEYSCDDNKDLKYWSTVTITEYNVEKVADALANSIEDSKENSEAVDIGAVRTTLKNIVDIRSPLSRVTDCVIIAVNAILSFNISSSGQESSNASSNILQLFEQQVSYAIEQHGKYNSTRPNIAVEGVTIRETQIRGGIGFTVGQTDEGFSEDDSRSFDPEGAETVGISIQLPQDALFDFDNESEARVSFIGYNGDKLFQSELLDDLNATVVVGPILSATVLGREVANLSEPVILQIETNMVDKVDPNAVKCVYWDFSKRDGIGDWAEDGCQLMSAESGMLTCQCDHLTNFAVLVDFSGQHGTFNFVLDIISKVGCAFSIVGLGLTLMIFLCCRGLRISLQRKILIQFCVSMLGLYFVFLIGIDSTHSNVRCIIVAALLHYFVVTTVLWMGVEARHMYITLVSESERVSRKFLIRAGIFAWGGGLIPVVIVLAIKQRHYIAESYCFLAPESGLFFGLLLPIGLVILHNIITFGLVAKKLMSSRSYLKKSDLENRDDKADDGEDLQKTGVTEIPQRLLNAFAVSILLGITWVFGFLAVEEARFAFQLLFCIFNSFQGVLIFLLFCYAQKDVRKIACGKCFPELPSQPALKQVKKPAATGATSVSSDTRLTGESYTEDNDTLVTSVNGMTMTAIDSEAIDNDEGFSQEDPVNTVNQKSTDVKESKEVTKQSYKNGINKKQGSNPEPVTEETVVSGATDTHNID